MNKILLYLLLFTTFFANSQYFEGFENGFPGTMTQTFLTGATSWSSCGGDTGGAVCQITGTASATFYLSSVNVAITELSTPILDLSAGNYRLSFNHIQRVRLNKTNFLYIELSQNGGVSWINVGSFLVDTQNSKKENINLPVATTNNCKIRFKASNKFGYAIVLDDISVLPVPLNDASMFSVALNPIFVAGNTPILGVFKNSGLNAISSIDVKWQVDGGIIYSNSLTGLNVGVNQTFNFTHSNIWNATAGEHSINVWIANTNGVDLDNSNDSLTKKIAVVNEVYSKTIVFEGATGTWCDWCPRGHVGIKDMTNLHENDNSFIGISVHNGDPMEVLEYDLGISNFTSGYPSGTMNRNLRNIDSGFSNIQANYQTEINQIPLGKINIADAFWEPTTREISFETQTTFALDILESNFKIAAIVVENNVRGINTLYDQQNAYSGGGAGDLIDYEGNNWSNLPPSVPAATMKYNFVGRTLLGGFNGFNNSVPAQITYNIPNNYSFSHTLPLNHDVNNIEIVALLLDNTTGVIINASKFNLGSKVNLNNERFSDLEKLTLYPNPSTGILKIKTDNPVKISIVDLLGKIVFLQENISNNSNIDLTYLQKGIYLVKIVSEKSTSTQKLILK